MYPQEADQSTFDRLMDRIGGPIDDRGPQKQAGDENLIVRFEYRAIENRIRSANEGGKKYDNVLFVTIQAAGQRDTVEREATDEDKERFSRQYQGFLNKQETVVDGTPIEVWPVLSPAEVAELKYNKIYSIEQIANLPDSRLSLMGMYGRKLRDKARDYFAASAKLAPLSAMRAENDALRAEQTRLAELCNKLAAQVAALTGQAMIPVQIDNIPVPDITVNNIGPVEEPEVAKVEKPRQVRKPKIEIVSD